jgi:hypothetical protein
MKTGITDFGNLGLIREVLDDFIIFVTIVVFTTLIARDFHLVFKDTILILLLGSWLYCLVSLRSILQPL